MLFEPADLKKDLDKVEQSLLSEFKKIRTGRPKVDMFDSLEVDVEAYKMKMDLKSLVTQVAIDKMALVISTYDQQVVKDMVKAISDLDLGVTIREDGTTIYVNFPPMTQERRQESVKEMHQMVEQARVRMRNIRREYIQEIDALEGVSIDEQKRSKDEVQKMVDNFDKHLSEISAAKEEDIKSI